MPEICFGGDKYINDDIEDLTIVLIIYINEEKCLDKTDLNIGNLPLRKNYYLLSRDFANNK